MPPSGRDRHLRCALEGLAGKGTKASRSTVVCGSNVLDVRGTARGPSPGPSVKYYLKV